MSNPFPPKAPGAVLDYAVDWSDWLDAGETIAESRWAVDPTGSEGDLVLENDTATGTRAVVWVSGGITGTTYTLTNHITTTLARQDERSLVFPVERR